MFEAPMLKLYSHPFSTYTRRVRIALKEKSIPCEEVFVDMAARKHREPEYLGLNPYSRVPTLVDDDLVLFESTAILNYLEALYPQPPLIPADRKGRALVDMHMKLCDLQFTRQAGAIVFPKRFMPKERWDEALFAQMRADIGKHLQILDGQLGDNDYVVGNRYSLVEVCYTPFVAFFELMEVTPPPRIAAWSKRILSRPSAQQTASEK
jgi:glutathione S-transferase